MLLRIFLSLTYSLFLFLHIRPPNIIIPFMYERVNRFAIDDVVCYYIVDNENDFGGGGG